MRGLPLGVGALCAAWCLRPMWDIDVFWHIAVGRLILDGGIPDRDVLSAADPAAPWRTFQWGYEALLAALDHAGGLRAVQVAHAAAFGAFGAVVAALLRPWGWARGALAFVLLWVLVEDRVRERPHVVELLFVALSLPLALGRLDAARGLAAALLAALWANLHAVSALWWLALFGARGVQEPRAAGWWALGLGLMLASPPAREGLWGALRSHSSWPAELVPELRPTWAWAQEGPWGVLLVGLAGLGLVAALARLRGPAPLAEKLIGLGCAVAAALMARWLPFAAVPLALALRELPAGRGRRAAGALTALLTAALLARVLPRWSLDERLEVLQAGRFPEAACTWLGEQGLAGPTDTSPAWTGYVLYRLHPPATVLSDGRLVFGPEVVELLMRRGSGEVQTFDEAAARFGTRVLLWPTQTRPPLDPARWVRVYGDPVAEVWLWRGAGP